MIKDDTWSALACDLDRYGHATDDRERLWHFDNMVSTVYERELDLSINQATEAVRELIRRKRS